MTQSSAAYEHLSEERHERQFFADCKRIAAGLLDLVGEDKYMEIIDNLPDGGPWATWKGILQAEYDQAKSRGTASVDQVHTDIVTSERP